MPRKYEMCTIVDAELDQQGLEEEIAFISESITSGGGNVVHRELWGRRTLAYPVKKKKEGYYYLFYFEAEPESIGKVLDVLKHREKILRTLVILKKEFPEFVKDAKSES
ncbi:MAG: 30S ribosomal protein S6 [Candidatus Omnitrophica bacterium]|nr:30S ribosomal protein S6 [Candidatus Omnitrophota bacterium]MCM8816600.1 30S ribosomal protein S6 [Candidatus Omnitrophota bacterium]